MESPHKSTFFDLEEYGTVAKFSLGKAPPSETPLEWRDLVVIDISGSMGISVEIIMKQTLPEAYKRLGLKGEDKIVVVAFETRTWYYEFPLKDLKNCNLSALDGTNMSGAIKKVESILSRDLNVPYRLLVISDGEVSDKDEVLRCASGLRNRLETAGRSAPTAVCQIRALTSSFASPDTQALASFGQLHFAGQIDLYDEPMQRPDLGGVKMVDTIVKAFKKVNANVHQISHVNPALKVFKRTPISTATQKLQVLEGDSVVLLEKGTKPEDLLINSVPLKEFSEVTKEKFSEEAVLPLLLFLESQVKQMMVLGFKKKDVSGILDWVKAVSEKFMKDEDEGDVVIENAASIMLRRRRLFKDLAKTSSSAIYRMKELANTSKVSEMNAEMQAKFLQGIGSGSQGKALAKRADKYGVENLEAIVQAELLKMAEKVSTSPLPEIEGEKVSFYSLETLTSCVNGLAEMDREQVSFLQVPDIMRFLGPIGLTFRCQKVDAPDPWSCLKVQKVFVGDETILNCADLWTDRTDSNQPLRVPGNPNETVSGIVPLRNFSPDAFDLFRTEAKTLFKLHVAASLRGSLVSLPGDLGALQASCAVDLIEQFSGSKNNAVADALYYLLVDLNHTGSESPNEMGIQQNIITLLNEGDPRAALAGDVNIASDLKPLAGILAGTVYSSAELARALIGYSSYLYTNKRVKGDPLERRKLIDKLLDIRDERETYPGDPMTPDTPSTQLYDSYDIEAFREEAPVSLLKRISLVFAAREAYDQSLSDPNQFKETFQRILDEEGNEGIVPRFFGLESTDDLLDLSGALALQSMFTADLSSRIEVKGDTRTSLLEDLNSAESGREYIKSIIRRRYEKRYEVALAAKREKEKGARAELLLKNLVQAPGWKEFGDLLQTPDAKKLIAGWNSPYAKPLYSSLLYDSNVPHRVEKIFVMILGEIRSKPFFNNGNVKRGDISEVEKVFKDEGNEQFWDKLVKARQQKILHKYRSSNKENRHGHSNDFPSWWARGFNSLNEFQKAKPDEAKEYIAKRLKQGKLWANKKYQDPMKKLNKDKK